MSAASLIPDRDTECRVMALLQCTHALISETDRIAALIADLIRVEPDSDVITDVIWNSGSPAEGVMMLKGELPAGGGWHS